MPHDAKFEFEINLYKKIEAGKGGRYLGIVVHKACGLNGGTINTEGVVVQELLIQIGCEGSVYNACCL
jgi:hypothetical protein